MPLLSLSLSLYSLLCCEIYAYVLHMQLQLTMLLFIHCTDDCWLIFRLYEMNLLPETIPYRIYFYYAVPLQAWSGPEASRKLRFPDFMTAAQDGGKVVSLTHRPPLPPGNTPGAHFC
jgi:hypothetical protein